MKDLMVLLVKIQVSINYALNQIGRYIFGPEYMVEMLRQTGLLKSRNQNGVEFVDVSDSISPIEDDDFRWN